MAIAFTWEKEFSAFVRVIRGSSSAAPPLR